MLPIFHLKCTLLRLAVFTGYAVFFILLVAHADDFYRFERMWPTLQQPWYFAQPKSITLGSEGEVYIADTLNNRIVKLDSSGKFITGTARASLIGFNRSYLGAVDLCLSMVLPDGSTFYLTDLAPSITTTPTPILTNWSPGSFPSTPILNLPLPEGLPLGDYSWKLAFTRTNQSISNSDGWLAQGRAVHGVQ